MSEPVENEAAQKKTDKKEETVSRTERINIVPVNILLFLDQSVLKAVPCAIAGGGKEK